MEALKLNTWICLILGGTAGTLLRYALAGWVVQRAGTSFPLGTLIVNLSGCFLVGFLTSLIESRWPFSASARLFLIAGFCGAFTTFSTLIFEFYGLIRNGELLKAFLYSGISFAAGFLLFCAGIWLAQKL